MSRKVLSFVLFCVLIVPFVGGSADAAGGERLVFSSWGKKLLAPSDIWSSTANGKNRTQLTNTKKSESSPAFSPDGTRITFTRGKIPAATADLFIMDADGTNQQKIKANAWSATWKPDGTKIAYVYNMFWTTEIYVGNPDGSGSVNLSDTSDDDESSPTWSPDGTKIAFVRTLDTPSHPSEVLVMDEDGSNVMPITDDDVWKGALDWSPDGSQMAYATENGIWRVDALGVSAPVQVTASGWAPAWSPDGTRLMFNTTKKGQDDLFTISPDGTDLHRVTRTDTNEGGVDWIA